MAGAKGGGGLRSPATFDSDSFAFVAAVVVVAFFRPLSVYAAFLSLCTVLSVFFFFSLPSLSVSVSHFIVVAFYFVCFF